MSAARSLHPSPRTLEVESLAGFDRLVAAGARSMHGWHVQSLDLRGRRAQLEALEAQGAVFLGCRFDDGVEDLLRGRGALIFPRLTAVPFNPYRGQLYTPQELYSGIATTPYEDTLDARVYQWSIRPAPISAPAARWWGSWAGTSPAAAPPSLRAPRCWAGCWPAAAGWWPRAA